jgi:hypothetical protein
MVSSGLAQKVIEGTVRDAQTGETLPSANIVIKDAYRGTITNRDGSYSLSIPDSLLPATIQVRFIGFNTVEKSIERDTEAHQNFQLTPSLTEMEELLVTDENPAIRIMREVIERKKKWRAKLETYKAEAYTRQNLSNDTSLVLITETASKTFWDKEKGYREVLSWRRQTENMAAGQNFAGVSYLPNFYDDNVEIAGFDVVGVTHPEALSYYNFELLDQLQMDGQPVYRIKVTAERKLQPLFEGEVFVLDGEYALLEVDLKPNSVVRFPPPVQDFNLSYSQQFSNYGGDFWLPVDVRISGTVKIGMLGLKFPSFNFRQLAKISSYEVNAPLPDSLYAEENLFSVDSTAIARDSLAMLSVEPVPLSRDEQQAYATLDSSRTLDKAFQPTGFMARFIDFSFSVGEDDSTGQEADSASNPTQISGGFPGQFAPRLRYNRVDELFAGLKYSYSPLQGLRLSVNGGYSTGYKKWSYGAESRYHWRAGRLRPQLGLSYQSQTATRYHSEIVTPLLTSVSNVLGYENYFDFFREEGIEMTAGITDTKSNLSLQAAFNSSEQTSLQTETAYDILGQSRLPRINPAIEEGQMNTLGFTLGYNLEEEYNFGIFRRNRIAFNVETSDESLGSDFNFTRYSAHLDWSFNTFYRRRIFPNTLNVSVDAGTFSGRLPLQKFGIVDVAPTIVSPFEGLRAARFRPYEGEQFAAFNLEHNFRTVPFERLGLTYLVEQNIGLILFGGAAKTWVSDLKGQEIFDRTGYGLNTTNGTHLEAGVSVNGIFNILRVDFAARLDEPGVLVGIGVSRFL